MEKKKKVTHSYKTKKIPCRDDVERRVSREGTRGCRQRRRGRARGPRPKPLAFTGDTGRARTGAPGLFRLRRPRPVVLLQPRAPGPSPDQPRRPTRPGVPWPRWAPSARGCTGRRAMGCTFPASSYFPVPSSPGARWRCPGAGDGGSGGAEGSRRARPGPIPHGRRGPGTGRAGGANTRESASVIRGLSRLNITPHRLPPLRPGTPQHSNQTFFSGAETGGGGFCPRSSLARRWEWSGGRIEDASVAHGPRRRSRRRKERKREAKGRGRGLLFCLFLLVYRPSASRRSCKGGG